MHPARTTCSRTPGTAEVSAATPAGEAGTVFHVAVPPAGRPDASVVSALPVPSSPSVSSVEPARVVFAGAGVHRLVCVPGVATVDEVVDALADVPRAAVVMGGFVGLDRAEVEFVEFDEPDPGPPAPWPGPGGPGPVIVGSTGSGTAEFPALAGSADAAAVSL